jgi:hypothetical protein
VGDHAADIVAAEAGYDRRIIGIDIASKIREAITANGRADPLPLPWIRMLLL